MFDLAQIEKLQRRKKYTLIAVIAISLIFLLACLFRFVPRVNDALAGRPRYTEALTRLMAEEFAKAAQGRFPVFLSGENDHCDPVPSTQIADDQIAGILYILTYSEHQRFSCVTSYAVPVDPSKFIGLESFMPEVQQLSGPTISHSLKVLPVARHLHVYSTSYLELLHWRVKLHVPISEAQAAGLAAQHYESRNPAVPADAQASIDISFEKARALVREPHDKINSWLMRAIDVLTFFALGLPFVLVTTYQKAAHDLLRVYGGRLSLSDFLTKNLCKLAASERKRYDDQGQERVERERKAAAELALRKELEERLRFALGNLHDEELRQRIQLCLNGISEIELMNGLLAEVQKTVGVKSPKEKLALLLESLESLCTEEELISCQGEAARILTDSGFRSARSYVIGIHDQFRVRMRQVEENGTNSQTEIGTK